MSAWPLGLGEFPRLRRALAAWSAWRPRLGTETLAVLASLFFALACNVPFWQAVAAHAPGQWRLWLALFLLLVALHGLLLGLVLNRWTAKPLLVALFVVTAFAAHYMAAYRVYLDPDMIRNVLHTEWQESRELLTPGLVLPLLLLAVVPVALLWRVEIVRRGWRGALGLRLAFLAGMLALAAAGVLLAGKDVAALMRNHTEDRYLVTPGNYVYALGRVLFAQPPGKKAPLLPVGEDAKQVPRAPGAKPRLLLLVVGETARAQNWGLDGYERQTTPELAAMTDLINFPQAHACGSSTEVSVPCMFSPFGRHDYDEDRIRTHQSLLHVLDRAGVGTLWRDNQTGCKGVCDGLPIDRLNAATDPEFCSGDRCLDEIMLKGLAEKLDPAAGDRVVVLHQLGNHGPSYYDRYPPQYRRFTPTCDTDELSDCTREQIVNSYDNALLYTDHFLARSIGFLRAQSDAYDTALLYVSDHGESLGEKGLYLHGVPYAIAPEQQLHVPMLMWFSPQFAADARLDLACLRDEAARPVDHDHLFPSVLALLDVRTKAYDASRDLFAACRRG
ncbi:phosphoethanolamine--lipid A transferase [Pseudoxanthomonas sangjuensis]|uniref:phosphoethanolamine transferase n=1 Tax=Pseudoxanthomonas sangjuensis TaxID=1503750 RepID=UPI001390C0E9|nr:phosphoethanolamine--lipid A transferase [Pseudoxanthomonas sangjuensis]KAF1714295.1 phosphoethanolamine transferase [Pseudoxanthomonas sangjuensis]